MDRRVTPPKRITSPTWGPPPPCKQTLRMSNDFLFLSLLGLGIKESSVSPPDKLCSACIQNRRCEEFGLVIESPCHFLNHQLRLVFVFALVLISYLIQ